MMNVNLSLTQEELALVGLSVRMHNGWLEDMVKSAHVVKETKDRYTAEIEMIPRILEVLTKLQVQRIMHDAGIVEPVTA